MEHKRRFGVSITSSIAEKLDKLATMLNIDRSRIVEEALKEYLHDQAHLLGNHKCVGLLIVLKRDRKIDIAEAIEEYKDIISAYNHVHVAGKCIETIMVSGDSARILSLKRKLINIGYIVRYIPISFKVYNKSENEEIDEGGPST
ncbi:MAG: ribbon-helix-helix domain-containing protein [Pyrodictiaceae archaeon]